MGVRRAQHHGVRLARPDDVVEVMAAPGQKAPILDASDGLTNAELFDDGLQARLRPLP
jgi:hypothetical protein